MSAIALELIRHRIRVGTPLAFAIRAQDDTLLLAVGQSVSSPSQLQQMIDRDARVAMDDLLSSAEQLRQAPREVVPLLWREGLSRVNEALLHAPHHAFRSALEDASEPVMTLVERDPDLAIFQVLRHDAGADLAYGVQRALNTAITASLVAQRLAWSPADVSRAFKAALTSNLSMLALQGELARQRTPLTPAQAHQLQDHPLRSAAQLEATGVADADWLHAVRAHHEMEDGTGYPRGLSGRGVGDLASLVRRADVYTSKLAARSHREALSADIAGRQMFMSDPGHPMTAALVKEFGVYPPGCQVRLADGSSGWVVQRGPTVTTPVVARMTEPDGRPLRQPQRVDTSDGAHRIVAVLGQRVVNAEATADKLLLMTLR